MSAKEKLLALAGGNIAESIDRERGPALTVHPAPPAGPAAANRYRGLDRIKGALAIPLDRIIPDPDQPRKEFDEMAIADLAASMKERGQLQPARVRFDDAVGSWVIVSGERRYRAALLAGLPALQAVEAVGPLTADEVLEDQLVENCLRANLKPIEQAHAFTKLMEVRGWSHRQLGDYLHIAPSAVSQALALLRLPEPLRERVEQGGLAVATAYQISKVDDPDAQVELAARVAAEGLTATDTAAVVKGRAPARAKGRGRKPTARVFRTGPGPRVTVEHKRGLTPDLIRLALLDAVAVIDAEIVGAGRDAG